jgi:hypothetical protein
MVFRLPRLDWILLADSQGSNPAEPVDVTGHSLVESGIALSSHDADRSDDHPPEPTPGEAPCGSLRWGESSCRTRGTLALGNAMVVTGPRRATSRPTGPGKCLGRRIEKKIVLVTPFGISHVRQGDVTEWGLRGEAVRCVASDRGRNRLRTGAIPDLACPATISPMVAGLGC